MGVIVVRLWRISRPGATTDKVGFKRSWSLVEVPQSLWYHLTQPELSTQVSESCHIVLPPSEEINRAVLPPLEDLQRPIGPGPTQEPQPALKLQHRE